MSMVVFSSVTKSFGDNSFAIKDVSFEIEPGELVLITGPSGSGKTTLMKLLIKDYEPTQGSITFEDISLDQIKSGQVPNHRRKIGVVFQDYKLLPDYNVWENIALALDIIGKQQHEIEERVTDLLNLIQLTDKAFLFPSQLSGGEAQRVSIARALALAPDLIFADEPTGNLDKDTSLSIAKLLEKINQLGTTILFATHDTSVIDYFKDTRHLILDNGSLVEDTGKKKKKKTKTEKESEPEPKPESESTQEVEQKKENKKEEEKEEKEPPKKKTRVSLKGLFSLAKSKAKTEDQDEPYKKEETKKEE